jgi:hypothetical protein
LTDKGPSTGSASTGDDYGPRRSEAKRPETPQTAVSARRVCSLHRKPLALLRKAGRTPRPTSGCRERSLVLDAPGAHNGHVCRYEHVKTWEWERPLGFHTEPSGRCCNRGTNSPVLGGGFFTPAFWSSSAVRKNKMLFAAVFRLQSRLVG